MHEVTLKTSTGELVTKAPIPAFLTPPIVIIWGDRVFAMLTYREYREVFAYVVPAFKATK